MSSQHEDHRAGFDPMEKDDWVQLLKLRDTLGLESTVIPFTVITFAIARIKRLYAERDEARAKLENMEIRSYYSPGEGAYYISERTIPARVRDSVIPLYGPKR